jgi:glutamate--cysteine ligase
MMKATASTQVAYDYSDEADASRKFAVALSLSPIINAAFANAQMFAGRSTGFTSFRGEIWQGMDPDRSGFLIELLAGEINYERWVDHVLDVPLLFIKVDDVLMPPPGITFRQWMQHRWRGRCPTLEDWDIHLSTIFTEVRLKKYLEIRGADATPTPLSIAVPAVWKGLLYNRQTLIAATELARAFPASEILDLSQAVARNGLRAQHRGRTIAAWCGDVVSIAMEGLKAIAFVTGHPDESIYLDPMRELLTSGRSPGELWPSSESVAVVIEQCEYM